MLVRRLYYHLKPVIPRRLQIELRRMSMRQQLKKCSSFWPIDERAAAPPAGWTGWPEGRQFAVVLTHDVETDLGQTRCRALAEMELRNGFRSSFNFVPEDYPVSALLRHELEENGFEVGVHGLTHDGKLFNSREGFLQAARRINFYLRQWKVEGFRSPAMHHNLEWMHDLDIGYDASTFDTDPFEPQPDGVCTIFPFLVNRNGSGTGYVELPYTLPQDFTLFILFEHRGIDTWKRKLDWIAERGGMALVITHPDYMAFSGRQPGLQEYPAGYYEDLLRYVASNYPGRYWNALPKDVSTFWRSHGSRAA